MKPYDFIAKNGIDYLTTRKEQHVTVRLLSDDGLVFSGKFVGVIPIGNNLPLIDGLLIALPQFDFHMLYTDPEGGGIIPLKFNLLLIDSMNDIKFDE